MIHWEYIDPFRYEFSQTLYVFRPVLAYSLLTNCAVALIFAPLERELIGAFGKWKFIWQAMAVSSKTRNYSEFLPFPVSRQTRLKNTLPFSTFFMSQLSHRGRPPSIGYVHPWPKCVFLIQVMQKNWNVNAKNKSNLFRNIVFFSQISDIVSHSQRPKGNYIEILYTYH